MPFYYLLIVVPFSLCFISTGDRCSSNLSSSKSSSSVHSAKQLNLHANTTISAIACVTSYITIQPSQVSAVNSQFCKLSPTFFLVSTLDFLSLW